MRCAFGLVLLVLLPAVAAAQAPTALFGAWAMHDRFVKARPGEMMDFHWSTATERYNPDYVHPTSWSVDFNACGSTNAAAFKWEFHGLNNGGNVVLALQPGASCKVTAKLPYLGTYRVTLTVTGTDGSTASTTQDITLRDLLIVSLGDSYASGDGAPEKWQTFDQRIAIGPWRPLVAVTAGPKWQDPRCLRSGLSGPAQAALEIEASDPHTSVTFLSFACAGAKADEGILHGYAGSVPLSPVLPSQLDQVRFAVGSSTSRTGVVQKGRRIHALIISIGGNDLGFVPIAQDCVTNDFAAHLWNADPAKVAIFGTKPYCNDHHPEFERNFNNTTRDTLTANYASIAATIRETLDV